MKKRFLCITLSLSVLVSMSMPVSATTKAEMQAKKSAAESQLNSVNSAISGIQGKQDILEEEISDIDSELVELLASISMIEDDIKAKEKEITQAQKDYDAAKAQEDEQYASMKERIKFMYEKGDAAYLQLFLEAKSVSDMLNKADYVEKLYAYDRELLETYEATKEEVAELKEELEDEKSELEATQYEYKQEQAELETTLDEKRATSADFDAELANAQAEAETYKAAIKKENDEIKAVEAQEAKEAEEAAAKKAAEEAAAAADSSVATDSGTSTDSSSSGESDSSSSDDSDSSVSGSGTGSEVARYACQFIGNPYVAGGTSLTGGADCSGFTWAVYQNFGVSIPRTSSAQRNAGTGVSYAEAQPGDIICYSGHVAIYIGGGQIVHASTERTGIKITNATYREILAVRRIV